MNFKVPEFVKAAEKVLIAHPDGHTIEAEHAFFDDFGNVLMAYAQGRLKLYSNEVSIEDTDDLGYFSISDAKGRRIFAITNEGVEIAGILFSPSNYDFIVSDAKGNILFDVSKQAGSTLDLESRGVYNLIRSKERLSEIDSLSPRITAGINHIVTYGQSLAMGNEGWPHLTRTPIYGNKMLGNSPRPGSNADPAFVPVGGNVFADLIATTQANSGAAILTEPQIAALTPGDQSRGESIDVSALNQLKKLLNDKFMVDNDATRTLLSTNCAVGGRSVAELSKNATPELFQCVQDAISISKSVAGAAAIRHVATIYNQGEQDYNVATSKASYKAALKQLRTDIDLEATAVYGASNQGAFFTYQTGGSYAEDANQLAVAMAQLELSLEEPGWYLAMPAYPYHDEGGHLTPNGYRNMGCKYGQVLYHVLVEGKKWRPTSPTEITLSESRILIDCHVPFGDLQFKNVWVGNTATDYLNKGFRVSDAQGNVPIAGVSILGKSIIAIDCLRVPDPNAIVWYADKTSHAGNGNVCDSDSFRPMYNYEFDGARGMESDENIPSLVGKPYEMNNWMVAFALPLGWKG